MKIYISFTPTFLHITILFLLLANISGCGFTRRTIAALRSTEDFIPLQNDSRILYEKGAEDVAREVKDFLADAAALVEKEQYRPFPEPIAVYICSSGASFSRHTGFPKELRAAVTVKLFLSAERLKKQYDGKSTRAILTHELSHLHFQQQLGIYGFGSHLPGWFREGMAVNISGGAGAESITEEQAVNAVLAGKHFMPNTTESFFFPKYGNAFGLEPHMFCRQSAMFVSFLKRFDEARFRSFILMLEEGRNFKKSFQKEFGIEVDTAWKQFIIELKKRSSK